jgi:hypothetical protein
LKRKTLQCFAQVGKFGIKTKNILSIAKIAVSVSKGAFSPRISRKKRAHRAEMFEKSAEWDKA